MSLSGYRRPAARVVGEKGVQEWGVEEGSPGAGADPASRPRTEGGRIFATLALSLGPVLPCPSGEEISLGWSSLDSLGTLPWFHFILFCLCFAARLCVCMCV